MNEEPEVQWVRFDLSTIRDISRQDAINKTGQKIELAYKHTKRDGTVITKTQKSFVTHSFCPFCGEEYP